MAKSLWCPMEKKLGKWGYFLAMGLVVKFHPHQTLDVCTHVVESANIHLFGPIAHLDKLNDFVT